MLIALSKRYLLVSIASSAKLRRDSGNAIASTSRKYNLPIKSQAGLTPCGVALLETFTTDQIMTFTR
ncbi:MAG: hypothetical protein HWQ43_12895 [Nostoc sp. JL31]|uniref:hypothetical protein n=1 Tax=Nostoc sp. JL31 TaxID=2815395 RepID=UPI0025EE66F1|nr:hypothetical protein [Nostoc sp. JL31]MBN3890021.1 hypothetical protein [Nostoc sp. JL31]